MTKPQQKSGCAANWHGCCPAAISRRPGTLLGRLSDADVPAELIARLAHMAVGGPFASVHEVMTALGINEPERRTR
jgi:hypothetical protein